VVGSVVDKFIFELEALLADKNVTLSLDAGARNWLAVRGYDAKMGARPMARLIQEKIKKPLAEDLLFGRLANGGHVRIEVENDALVFAIESKQMTATELNQVV
jgi:ATP-dependent Clp protease ATP-binding subunit ClpA